MKRISRTTLLLTLFALVLPAAALDLSDLMNPDDVMLRRPAQKTQPAARRPAMPPTTVTPRTTTTPPTTVTPRTTTAPQTTVAPRTTTTPQTTVAPRTTTAPQTTVAPQTRVQPKIELVTRTNVVTKTDYVIKTNTVTKTDYVTKTNVVTQTAYVTKTNTITKMDYVTNVVTQTDYVTKTNVVVEKVIDESEKKTLEAQRNQAARDAVVERSARENAEAARGAAERKAVAAQAAQAEAEAEMARMKAELAKAEEARRLAEAKLKAAETKAAVAEKKAAAAETAREEVASQVDEIARKALDERKARERAETEKRAAERRAETERNAALAVAKKLDAVTNAPPPTIETPDYAPDRPMPAETPKAAAAKKPADASGKDGKGKELTGRDAIITADRMDYDRKEGVILFDRNVYIDDEQYQMHADRLFVFLETNAVEKVSAREKGAGKGRKPDDKVANKDKPSDDKTVAKKDKAPGKDKTSSGVAGLTGGNTSLKRLVAIGHVSITNEARSAYCARATYMKKTGKIVMYGNDEITPWILDPQQSKTPQYGEKITFWTVSEQVEIEKPVLSGAALGKGKGGSPLDMLKK